MTELIRHGTLELDESPDEWHMSDLLAETLDESKFSVLRDPTTDEHIIVEEYE